MRDDYSCSWEQKNTTSLETMASWALKKRARKITNFKGYDQYVWSQNVSSCFGTYWTSLCGVDTDPKNTTSLETMASWALKKRARKMTNFKGYDRYVWSKNVFSCLGAYWTSLKFKWLRQSTDPLRNAPNHVSEPPKCVPDLQNGVPGRQNCEQECQRETKKRPRRT